MEGLLEPRTSTSEDALCDLLRDRAIAVLAGAGCSTESGIPDYRGPEGALRTRKPMQYQEFVRSGASRARYWARSAIGWPRMALARPNPAHSALARLEEAGVVAGIITQNVDGLHQAAGSTRVVELHGTLAGVRCLECDQLFARDDFQERLMEANRGWAAALERGEARAEVAPDGDAELDDAFVENFHVPACTGCAGVLKPDVVFFGENVPKRWVEDAWRVYEAADVLLVIGSSLTVYSGRRFVYRAGKEAMPVAIINLGPTRADAVAAARLEGRVGEVLPRLAAKLV